MTDLLVKLSAPFRPERISWRVGSTTQDKKRGMALAYIDARDVQDRLDEVCGTGWQVRTPWCVNGRIACEIGIKIGDEWIWRGDGAGETDVEADKGAFSDAFKRAAVRWGIGRYLYDLDSPWVELKPAGRSYAIADGEHERLRKLLAGKATRPAMPPEVRREPTPKPQTDAGYQMLAEGIRDALKQAPTLEKLDIIMDLNRATIATLPQVTANFLNGIYAKRKAAMESVT